MIARFCCLFFLLLSLALPNVETRPFLATIQGGEMNEEVSRIGSSPPSCDHKCYGCMPCEAIQVPTTTATTTTRVGAQYTNYKPEGWKCKCGPTLYSP